MDKEQETRILLAMHFGDDHPYRCHCESCDARRNFAILDDLARLQPTQVFKPSKAFSA